MSEVDDTGYTQEAMNDLAISTASVIVETLRKYTGGESHTRDGHIAKIDGYVTLLKRGGGHDSYYRDMIMVCIKQAMKWMTETGTYRDYGRDTNNK